MKRKEFGVAFKCKIKNYILKYVKGHLTIENYEQLLGFIDNRELKEEIIKELYSIRYIYKVLEGLSVKDELLIMEAKIQILSYSSIYEAIVDYLLFEKFLDTDEVKNLREKITYKHISLPKYCDRCKKHDDKDILFMYKKLEDKEQREIKFKNKLNSLFNIIDFNIYKVDEKGNKILKISSDSLKKELEEFYDYRNMIHIYKKLRDNQKGYKEYTLELAKNAFWRLKPFLEKINEYFERNENDIKLR